MKIARTIGLLLTICLVVLAAAAAWVVFFYDTNRLKPQLTGPIEKRLDREVSIEGDLKIVWALPPALVVNELAIANSSWASDPHLATVQRITATLDWGALLGGTLRLDRLEVHGASVALQQNDAGEWNLPTPTSGDGEPQPAGQSAGRPLNTFLLTDSALQLQRADDTHQVDIERLRVMLGEADQSSQASLTAQYRQIPLSIETTLSPTRALFQSDTALDLEATLAADANRLSVEGSLASLANPMPLDLRLTVDAPDPTVVAPLVTVPAALQEGVNAGARLQKASAEKPYRLSDLKVTAGPNDIGGRIELDLSGQPMQLRADLNAEHLDLRPYLAPEETAKAPAAESSDPPEGAPDDADASNDQLFSAQPFDLGWLDRIEADVAMAAQELLLHRVGLSDLDAALTLEGGRLDLAPLSATVGGGALDAALHLAKASPPSIDATLTVKALDVARMLEDLALPVSMHGDLGLKIDLRGQGASPAELAASLDGQFDLAVQDGRMASRYLEKAQWYGFELTDAFVQLFKPGEKDETTEVKINCLICSFDVNDGIADSKALVFDTPVAGVVGNGQINLKTEALNIALKPVTDGGIGIPGLAKLKIGTSITDGFKLSGTLAFPSISLDKSEATMTLFKSLGGMLLLGPVGLTAGLLDTGLGADNPCVKVLQQAGTVERP